MVDVRIAWTCEQARSDTSPTWILADFADFKRVVGYRYRDGLLESGFSGLQVAKHGDLAKQGPL